MPPDDGLTPLGRAATTTAVDVVLETLSREGVRYVFGVPGGNLVPLYEALTLRSDMSAVLVKHEEGGACMADGYARVSRTLGVCCGIAGPGATHALTGVAGAYSDSVAMLFLSGQVATSVFGKGAIQDSTGLGIDIVEMLRPVTKLSTMVVNAESAPRMIRHAIRVATTGRPGPVHLNLPGDVGKTPVDAPTWKGPLHPTSQPVDMLEVSRAAGLLSRAKHPAILAGSGVSLLGAWTELRQLAETGGIPVATTPKAKGVFPETHPLSLGVFGFAGHQRATQYLSGEVDVLLVVGSSLGEFQTNAWDERLRPSKALIQIDIDPGEIGKNYETQVSLVADARIAMTGIEAQLKSMGPDATAHTSLPRHLLELPQFIEGERMASSEQPIKPQRVMAELRAALPDDGIVFSDIGNCISWLVQYFEIREPDTFFLNLGLASMGWSVPASIGGQLAAPERKVVAVMGDGAFSMLGMEVHSAVEHDVPVTFIVLNDGGLGMVEQGDLLVLGRSVCPARYRHPIDAAGVAIALGARGIRVTSPDELAGALTDAIASDRPTVVDIRVDPTEVPATLRMRTDSLRRMFEAGESDGPTDS